MLPKPGCCECNIYIAPRECISRYNVTRDTDISQTDLSAMRCSKQAGAKPVDGGRMSLTGIRNDKAKAALTGRTALKEKR